MKEIYSCLILFCFLGLNNDRVFGETYIKDEIFVRFEENITENQKSLIIKEFELEEKTKFILTKAILYKIKSGKDPRELIPLLTKNSRVKYADLNGMNSSLQSFSSSEPFFPRQWSLNNDGQVVNGKNGVPGADIDWIKAMEIYKPKKQIGVAVVDSGVALRHPEIALELGGKVLEQNGKPGVDDDGNGFIDDFVGWDFVDNDNLPEDLNGHGSMVAGIIGAHPNNGLGITGVAPDSFIVPLRVFDETGGASDAVIISAAGYAVLNEVKVINLSLTKGNPFHFPLQEAIYNLEKEYNTLLVCAAGNGGSDQRGDNIDSTPVYPAAYDGNAIISVAATNQNNELTPFSNYGLENVDIAAPGDNIYAPSVSRKNIYFENFENTTNWKTYRTSRDYSGSSWSYHTDSFGNRWVTDSNDFFGNPINYAPYTDIYLRSPAISLKKVRSPKMFVRVYHNLPYNYLYGTYDYLFFEVSTDGGNSWSSIGYTYGLSRPGGSIYNFDLSKFEGFSNVLFRFRLASDGVLQGDGVYVDNFHISGVTDFDYSGSEFNFNSGTSFSAPIVSGVAALVLSHRPDLLVKDVREILLQSVTKVEDLKGKIATGGVVNAYKALKLAETWRSLGEPAFNFLVSTSFLPSQQSAGSVSGGGSYEAGSTVSIVANPSSNYTFSHWTGGASGSENPLQYTVIADTEIIANFEKSILPTVPLWSDSNVLGHGWKSFDWFGSFWESSTPWIYHVSLGWLYRVGDQLSSLWFYNQQKGWMYTSSSTFPHLYLNENQSWSYVSDGLIFSYKTNSWSSF
tara:strand:- start:384 stop:2765 length:2382 start_codon:yes stop_codon:yes gene_type:complete